MTTEPAFFGPQSFRDLVRLLEQHPEWRADLRRLVLSDELLELPALVRGLAEAQGRTEERLDALGQRVDALVTVQAAMGERLDALTQRVDALVNVQAAMGERLDTLTQRVDALVDVQAAMGERLDALAEAQRRTETVLQALIGRTDLIETRLGAVRGETLELRYRAHSGSYFGPMLRRARPVSQDELDDLLEAGTDTAKLTNEDAQDVRRADIVIRGREPSGNGERYLVVEVSAVVDTHDVERAKRRAATLRKVCPAGAVVAGEQVTPDAERDARLGGVWQVLDGRVVPPDGAETP